MSPKLRIATFNLENFDETSEEGEPSLEERISLMRPQLVRVNADIFCLQEVNGQREREGEPRRLSALKKLLEGTRCEDYEMVSTMLADGSEPYDERNLVVLSRFGIAEHAQYKHVYAPAPYYRTVTDKDTGEGVDEQTVRKEAEKLSWERPILVCRIQLGEQTLHVLNVHLKSKRPTNIPEQKEDRYTWKTASGWAEGFFLSSMKRVGQALETRMLIDSIFDEDPRALIVACGDFNADTDDVPLQAIRGDVESHDNPDLAERVMVPVEKSIPEPARYSLLYLGKGEMIDHLLVSRQMLQYFEGSEIHNELLHDESISFATDVKYPESDHAPVMAEFEVSEGWL
ncbi:MAG: endonuclease/exonuclease/phosphatase family protein [Rubrobacteraceae bacterium]